MNFEYQKDQKEFDKIQYHWLLNQTIFLTIKEIFNPES